VESGEMTDTISDVSHSCITDQLAANRSETFVSCSYLLAEVEVDGVESGEMTDTISDVSHSCITDLLAANRSETCVSCSYFTP